MSAIKTIPESRKKEHTALELEMVNLVNKAIKSSGDDAFNAVKVLSEPKFADVSYGWKQFNDLIKITKEASDGGARSEAFKALAHLVLETPEGSKFGFSALAAYPKYKLFEMSVGEELVYTLRDAAMGKDKDRALRAFDELQCPDSAGTAHEKFDATMKVIEKSPHREVREEAFKFVKGLKGVSEEYKFGAALDILASSHDFELRGELIRFMKEVEIPDAAKARIIINGLDKAYVADAREELLTFLGRVCGGEVGSELGKFVAGSGKEAEDICHVVWKLMETASGSTIEGMNKVILEVIGRNPEMLEDAKKRVSHLIKNRENDEIARLELIKLRAKLEKI